MSFIGNVPAEAFSPVAKDTRSGDGSTTDFTLSIPATTNSVEVFVENVQQEPTTSYTISGTTLSFTAPPVTGTDNIYVIHRGPAVQTVVPPAGIPLSATTVSATGDISTEGDLKVEVTSGGIYTITGTDTATNRTLTLPDEAGTVLTSASTIDSSKVLPSGQTAWPAFRVALTADQLETATATAITAEWDRTSDQNCYLQGGMSISSGVITVPVDGIYLFSAVLRVDFIGSGFIVGSIVVNDEPAGNKDAYIIAGNPATDFENLTGSVHFKLSAGDTVRTTVTSQTDTNWRIDNNSSFSGSLIAAE